MESLQSVKTHPDRSADRRTSMTQLIRMAREGRGGVAAAVQENFRAVLRLLLENLSDEAGASRALVFGVLTEMLRQERLIPSFQAFTELIILKVLEAHRDEEKDVSGERLTVFSDALYIHHGFLFSVQVERAAEGCAAAMAGVLPPDLVIRVLNPIVKTGDYPVNQAAIKMLTRAAEHPENSAVVRESLGDIMPGLLKVIGFPHNNFVSY